VTSVRWGRSRSDRHDGDLGARGEEPLRPRSAVQAEAMDERGDRRRVQQRGGEHHDVAERLPQLGPQRPHRLLRALGASPPSTSPAATVAMTPEKPRTSSASTKVPYATAIDRAAAASRSSHGSTIAAANPTTAPMAAPPKNTPKKSSSPPLEHRRREEQRELEQRAGQVHGDPRAAPSTRGGIPPRAGVHACPRVHVPRAAGHVRRVLTM